MFGLGLNGCARTGGNASESIHSDANQGSSAKRAPIKNIPVPDSFAMPYPLNTLREEFDARVRWNEGVLRTEADKRIKAKGGGGYSIRETFVMALEETGRE